MKKRLEGKNKASILKKFTYGPTHWRFEGMTCGFILALDHVASSGDYVNGFMILNTAHLMCPFCFLRATVHICFLCLSVFLRHSLRWHNTHKSFHQNGGRFGLVSGGIQPQEESQSTCSQLTGVSSATQWTFHHLCHYVPSVCQTL